MEKERYEIRYEDDGFDINNDFVEYIVDTKTGEYLNLAYIKICDLLNQQDARIKELEKENHQLKQSQQQLAIEELRRIKDYILINDEYDEEVGCNIIETFEMLEDIRDRINKLGGGENE